MDFTRNPSAKLPHCDRLGPLVSEDGPGVPMMREAFLPGSALVIRLLCIRPHNNRYVALGKMRLSPPRHLVLAGFATLGTT